MLRSRRCFSCTAGTTSTLLLALPACCARRPGGPGRQRAGARGRRPRRVRALDGAQHDLGHDVDDLDAASIAGYLFGNPVSFADGGTGNPTWAALDSRVKDLQANLLSLTLSAAQGQSAPAACAPESGRGDSENSPALAWP